MKLDIMIVAFVLALMMILLGVTLVSAEDTTRSYFDRNGSFAGSSNTHSGGRDTTFTDRDGKFSGSAIRNSDGTTSFYDRSGRFTGTNTNQPK
jgi:hypothetical protein